MLSLRYSLWPLCLTLAGLSAAAQPLPSDPLERECWQRSSYERTRLTEREPTAVAVSNLRSGMTVGSPFRVDFSIRGMGVIPAGKPHPKAGHHHMLVNTPLPVNPGDKIPFNDFHRHYGKGQTGAVIALPAGEHRLRLLFADHDHKPYFVFSPELRITVRGPRAEPGPRVNRASFDASCAAWYAEEVSRPRPEGQRVVFGNVRDGESVVSPVNLRFAADGFGIAPKGQGDGSTGYFVLSAERNDGRDQEVVDLSNGATQATLALSRGTWDLTLRLVDNGGQRDLVAPARMRLNVTAVER